MLIKNGNVHNGLGEAGRGDIRIEDGKILQLGSSLQPKEGEEVFDAEGMEILPGFVQAISSWGVNGGRQEIRPSSDDNDEKSSPITPELDAFYAFNGRSATAQQLGAFGLTVCGVAPTDNNLFGGTIAAFEIDGVNPYKMCLKRGTAMMASVTDSLKKTYGTRPAAPQTRMWIFANFEEQLRKAAEYQEKPASDAANAPADGDNAAGCSVNLPAETGNAGAGQVHDDKLAALKKVTEGELPLFVACDSALAAERVHEITEKYPKLRLVLVNGFGLTGEEDWIAERRIPVIVRTPSYPLDESAMELDLNAMAKLAAKGVPVALSGERVNSPGAREDMLWNGAEMMRILHDCEAVLPMLTSVPAEILGIADQTGSIREGLRADLVIWNGNPLKTWQAEIIRTYQAGRVIYQKGDEMRCM